jgi:peptide chain release factor 1
MKELHLTKKDFKLEWFSGQGAGGQHRNKHQNCCRITHIESGLTASGQNSRSRVDNQREAFNQLASRLFAFYDVYGEGEIEDNPHRDAKFGGGETIRNYHAVRNEVHDKASGLKMPYKSVVIDGDIGSMIEARHEVKSAETI